MFNFILLSSILFGWVHTQTNVDTNTSIDPKVIMKYEWNSMDFDFPDIKSRNDAIKSGRYIPGAAELFDADFHYRNGIFVTTPRIHPGVPATFGYLQVNISGRIHASIKPYPNLDMHIDIGNCDHIQNVYRIKVDECDRLWVIDTGRDYNGLHCPPKLLVFDLINDRLLVKHTFNTEYLSEYSLLVAPVVDIRNNMCDETFVYIADVGENRIVVYDHVRQASWYIRSQRFHQVPEFNVDYRSFVSSAENFELTLGPVDTNRDRKLYFHELQSGHHGYVMTSHIRSFEPATVTKLELDEDVVILPYARARSKTEVMDENGILFYHSGYDNSIHCWTLDFNANFVHDQSTKVFEKNLEMITNIKIVSGITQHEILFITTILDDSQTAALPPSNRTNYRIVALDVHEIIKNTVCGPIRSEIVENDIEFSLIKND